MFASPDRGTNGGTSDVANDLNGIYAAALEDPDASPNRMHLASTVAFMPVVALTLASTVAAQPVPSAPHPRLWLDAATASALKSQASDPTSGIARSAARCLAARTNPA